MKFVLVLVLPLLLLSPRLYADEVKPVVVPFEMAGTDVIVTATVNGMSVRLAIDTGAYQSMFRKEIIPALKLLPPDILPQREARYFLPPLSIGNITLRDAKFGALPDEAWLKSQAYWGLLGLDALKNYAVGFDMQSKQLTFWQGGNLTEDQISSYLHIPNSTEPISILPLMDKTKNSAQTFILCNNEPVPVFVDTGSSSTLIGKNQAKSLRLIRRGSQTTFRTLYGDAKLSIALLRQMRLDAFVLPYVAPKFVQESKNAFIREVNLLGMDVLGNTRFVFDFPAQKLALRPVKPLWLKLTSLWNQLGVTMLRGSYFATYPNTAAAKARLPRIGKLFSVNGLPLESIYDSEEIVARLLTAPSFTFSAAQNTDLPPNDYILSVSSKLEVPLSPPNGDRRLFYLTASVIKTLAHLYPLSHKDPMPIKSGGDIRVFYGAYAIVTETGSNEYPYGATAYTSAYTGEIPDVPAGRRQQLADGVIVILNTAESAK